MAGAGRTMTRTQLAGGTKEAVNTLLRNEQEVYGAGNREMFSVALGLARKISMDVCYKLAANDADTLKKARKWFLDDTGTDDDLKKITKILSDGFKKISALCNSSVGRSPFPPPGPSESLSTIHDLRQSFASVAASAGESLYIVGKILGHQQARTTEVYAHLAPDPVQAAADRAEARDL
jgi:Phage integrase family